MPSKTEEYLALAQRTANGLTRYWESWTDYLTTASRLYKYPFADQLMIYAQRPDATACADFDIWNNRMNRYVRRGAKGIALLDESSGFPRLHYVFDVSDTGVRRNSRDPEVWQYNDDLKQPVSEMLSKTYHSKAEELPALLPLAAATEYNTLKEQHPDALVGFEQNGQFEFYGEDARKVCELVGGKLLEKETALGTVPVTGFPSDQWAHRAKQLWQCGENVYLAGLNEGGTHHQTKYLRREDYLPLGATVHMEGRAFRVDNVNFDKDSVSLQDVALAEMRMPVFRQEPLAVVRELYEQEQDDRQLSDEELDELPISAVMDGKVQTFPDAAALDEALNAEPAPEPAGNFHITDDHLGEGGAKQKFARNIEAIRTLFKLEQEHRGATAEEQQVLSRYVGWGGLADAFDPGKDSWTKEYAKRYHIDYSIQKDLSCKPPRYLVYFKAQDTDALSAAFKEYSASVLDKTERPSVLAKLHDLAQSVANLPDKVRHKQEERGL